MSSQSFHVAMPPFKLFTYAFALILPLSLLGCPSNTNQPARRQHNSPAPKTTTDFDAERAFEYVRKQVEFGPRPAGSAELGEDAELHHRATEILRAVGNDRRILSGYAAEVGRKMVISSRKFPVSHPT
jgi:hypothetical protein